MNAMPLNVAQQLVADRRASYEGVALRSRLRRIARRPVYEAQTHESSEPRVPAPVVTIADAPEPARDEVAVGS
jgi:hypothetical protein